MVIRQACVAHITGSTALTRPRRYGTSRERYGRLARSISSSHRPVTDNSAFASGSAVAGVDVHRVFGDTRIQGSTVQRSDAHSPYAAVGGIFHNPVGDLFVENTTVMKNAANADAVANAVGGLLGSTLESGGVPGDNTLITNSTIKKDSPVNCNFVDPCLPPLNT